MDRKPKITFLFPYRWLVDPKDNKYLGANLIKQITKFVGGSDNLKELKKVIYYTIFISYQAHRPVEIPLTKTQLQKLLKPIFTNGKLIDFDYEFRQHRSKTMLPLCDFQIIW